jgi:hypothetical protein
MSAFAAQAFPSCCARVTQAGLWASLVKDFGNHAMSRMRLDGFARRGDKTAMKTSFAICGICIIG